MGLESDKRTIGNHTYEVVQLGSLKARQTLVRLLRIAGPVFGRVLNGLGLEEGASLDSVKDKINAKVLGTLVETLAENVNEADLEYLCETFGASSFVHVDGKRIRLDMENQELHFKGGNLLNLFKWLAFAIEWNYSDFFAGLAKPKTDPPGVKVS